VDLKQEAVRLKDAIERELGVPVRVRAGAPGSLRVLRDGEQVYSLKEDGHAAAEDVVGRLRR
jgi:hypothetical protein